jgi:hypothetical protein
VSGSLIEPEDDDEILDFDPTSAGRFAANPLLRTPESFEEGSVGRMLFELLAMCWPGMPVKALVTRSHDDPGRLEAELQAHLGVLE